MSVSSEVAATISAEWKVVSTLWSFIQSLLFGFWTGLNDAVAAVYAWLTEPGSFAASVTRLYGYVFSHVWAWLPDTVQVSITTNIGTLSSHPAVIYGAKFAHWFLDYFMNVSVVVACWTALLIGLPTAIALR